MPHSAFAELSRNESLDKMDRANEFGELAAMPRVSITRKTPTEF